jgi:hypothetical protein
MSTTGWIVMIVLAVVVVAFNLSLFSAIKNRGKSSSPREGVLGKTVKSLRDPYPWRKEDAQLSELSQRMDALRQNTPPDSDQLP